MMSLEDTEHKKYLGDVIYSNGRNEKNLEERKKERSSNDAKQFTPHQWNLHQCRGLVRPYKG